METWKPVFGFESDYEVSDLGNVKRISPSRSYKPNRLLKLIKMKIGYQKVCLTVGGKYHQRYVHRLVAEAFLGACPIGITVNHINGVRDDNRLCNLEYATRSQQEIHSISVLGKASQKGEAHPRSKLTNEQVMAIRKLADTHRTTWIAKLFGICHTTVIAIRDRKLWKHL